MKCPECGDVELVPKNARGMEWSTRFYGKVIRAVCDFDYELKKSCPEYGEIMVNGKEINDLDNLLHESLENKNETH